MQRFAFRTGPASHGLDRVVDLRKVDRQTSQQCVELICAGESGIERDPSFFPDDARRNDAFRLQGVDGPLHAKERRVNDPGKLGAIALLKQCEGDQKPCAERRAKEFQEH